jgi:hypothetical protein
MPYMAKFRAQEAGGRRQEAGAGARVKERTFTHDP